MADITSLISAGYMMSSASNISGSQNSFFDRIKSTVKVDTMFNNSGATYFDCRSLRVWTPEDNDFNGDYFITTTPSTVIYNEASNLDFTSHTWSRTSDGYTYTISYSNGVWYLKKGNTVISSNTITTQDAYGNWKRPISGNYTNIFGKSYFPVITWTNASIPGFKIVLRFTDSDNPHDNHYYGFTPYINNNSTIKIDWGDGSNETYDNSYSGKIINHYFDFPDMEYDSGEYVDFEINIVGSCNRVVFGNNRTHRNIVTDPQYWVEYTYHSSYDSNTLYGEFDLVESGYNYWIPKWITHWKLLNYRSSYDIYQTYNKDDLVYNGSPEVYYVCIKDGAGSINYHPPTDTEYWKVVTDRGYYNSNSTYNTNEIVFLIVNSTTNVYECILNETIGVQPNQDGIINHTPPIDEYSEDEYWKYIIYEGDTDPTIVYNDYACITYNSIYYILRLPVNYDNYSFLVRLSNFDWSYLGELSSGYCMFNNCINLGTTYNMGESITPSTPATYNYGTLNSFPLSMHDGSYMFYECWNDLATFNNISDLGFIYDGSYMFYDCTNAEFNNMVDINHVIINSNYMFSRCSLAKFDLIEYPGLTETTSDGMFEGCTSATFDSLHSLSSYLVSANNMFSGCVHARFSPSIASKASSIIPSTLQYANSMFSSCGRLTTGQTVSGTNITDTCNLTISKLPSGLIEMGSMFRYSKVNNNIDNL